MPEDDPAINSLKTKVPRLRPRESSGSARDDNSQFVILYYITDRKQLAGDETQRRTRLLEKIEEAARAGVDHIQLRERDLSGRELEELARAAMVRVRNFPKTKLLINSRVDIAIAVGAHGVHLRADDMNAGDAHAVFDMSPGYKGRTPVIAVSCHSAEEVAMAESQGADFAVLAPIFEKHGSEREPLGLKKLERACRRPAAAASRMPVLALGGITLANAANCLAAGAAGVAGIRLFQNADVASVVRELSGSVKASGHERHPYWPGSGH